MNNINNFNTNSINNITRDYDFDNWGEGTLNEFLEESVSPINKKRTLSGPCYTPSEIENEISKSTKKNKSGSGRSDDWTEKECNVLIKKMNSLLEDKEVFSSQKQLFKAIPNLEKRSQNAKKAHLTVSKCSRGCRELFSKVRSELIKKDKTVFVHKNLWPESECDLLINKMNSLLEDKKVFSSRKQLLEALPNLKNRTQHAKRAHLYSSKCSRGCTDLFSKLRSELINQDTTVVVQKNSWLESDCTLLMGEMRLLQASNEVFNSQQELRNALPKLENCTQKAIYAHLTKSECSNGCRDLFQQLSSRILKIVKWDLSRCKSLQKTMNSIMESKEEAQPFKQDKELLEKIGSEFDETVAALVGHIKVNICTNGCVPVFEKLQTAKVVRVNSKKSWSESLCNSLVEQISNLVKKEITFSTQAALFAHLATLLPEEKSPGAIEIHCRNKCSFCGVTFNENKGKLIKKETK